MSLSISFIKFYCFSFKKTTRKKKDIRNTEGHHLGDPLRMFVVWEIIFVEHNRSMYVYVDNQEIKGL